MTATTSQLPQDPTTGWRARLQLRFAGRGSRTVLVERRHEGPLLVQRPLYPEGGVCHVVILHPPGGVAGGDSLDITVGVEAGAHAVLTTPGATRWYKSGGRPSAQRITLSLAAGARLDWLPQENILFDGAHAQLATHVTVARGASVLGWDAVVFGRRASGETWTYGALQLATRIDDGARALWLEQAQVSADSPLRTAAVGLHGYAVMGTLWAVGDGATEALAEALAGELPRDAGLCAGVTRLAQPDQAMLLLRVLGAEVEPVRHLLQRAWAFLRAPIHGVEARPLRLWAT